MKKKEKQGNKIVGDILMGGILLVIQDMFLIYDYAGGDFIAKNLIKEYGYTLEEWLKAQKKSG